MKLNWNFWRGGGGGGGGGGHRENPFHGGRYGYFLGFVNLHSARLLSTAVLIQLNRTVTVWILLEYDFWFQMLCLNSI